MGVRGTVGVPCADPGPSGSRSSSFSLKVPYLPRPPRERRERKETVFDVELCISIGVLLMCPGTAPARLPGQAYGFAEPGFFRSNTTVSLPVNSSPVQMNDRSCLCDWLFLRCFSCPSSAIWRRVALARAVVSFC